MNNVKKLIITTNGPGEMTSWVRPVLNKLSGSGFDITVMLMPCRFATGREFQEASGLPGVSEVISADKSLSIVFSGKATLKSLFNLSDGAVLFLGGDPLWAFILARRLGYKVFGYSEHDAFLFKFYDRHFLRNRDGDLMTDAFGGVTKNISDSVHTIAIFAGSRYKHFRLFIPFYEPFINKMKDRGFRFILGVSPFISEQQLEEVKSENDLAVYEEIIFDPEQVLSKCDFLITMPGTNTAQAAIARVPYCVLVPLNAIEEIPLEGLGGLIADIPYIGKFVRKLIIRYMKNKIKFFALPNVKASEKIIPEICDVLTTDNTIEFVDSVISNKGQMEKSVKRASEIMSAKGVAEEIAMELKGLYL